MVLPLLSNPLTIVYTNKVPPKEHEQVLMHGFAISHYLWLNRCTKYAPTDLFSLWKTYSHHRFYIQKEHFQRNWPEGGSVEKRPKFEYHLRECISTGRLCFDDEKKTSKGAIILNDLCFTS